MLTKKNKKKRQSDNVRLITVQSFSSWSIGFYVVDNMATWSCFPPGETRNILQSGRIWKQNCLCKGMMPNYC